MACGKCFLFLFALLAIQASVLAEEESDSSSNSQTNNQDQPARDDSHHDDRASPFNLGQLFGGQSGFTDPFGQLLSSFGQFFPGLGGTNSSANSSSSFPFFPFLPSSSRSQEIFPSGLGDDETASPQDRFFFHVFQSAGIPIGCNYTSQAGYSCAGCREQLLCRPNGVGRLRICPFYAPYCYNGVCGSLVNTTCTNSTG